MTLAPNGNLLVVCNDSGYVFRVDNIAAPPMPSDLRLDYHGTKGVTLTWTGVAGQGYRVERSPTLAPDTWQLIGAAGSTLPGTVTFSDPTSAVNGNNFYRLVSSF